MPGAGKCHEEARASGHCRTSRTGLLGHAAKITLMGLRLTTNLTEDQRHDEWARIIRRIAEEHVGHAWSNYMFRLLRAVFNVNRRLAQSGRFLGKSSRGNYGRSALHP